ncbi:MAG: HK97 family phage prohead protease [Bacteroides sp.]|nr:HK97 family phage prohead protease [Bacteroides sp.]
MSRMETISHGLQLRRSGAEEAPAFNEATVEGYAIVWGSVNDYGEMCNRGCCAKSLKERGLKSKGGNQIRFLLQHDTRQILGKLEALEEDDKGLFFRANIYQNLSYSRDALELIKAGELRQLSYGFSYSASPGAYTFRDDGVVVLNEIDLYEISLVTFSSDSEAQLRSRREDVRAMWEALRREQRAKAHGLADMVREIYGNPTK